MCIEEEQLRQISGVSDEFWKKIYVIARDGLPAEDFMGYMPDFLALSENLSIAPDDFPRLLHTTFCPVDMSDYVEVENYDEDDPAGDWANKPKSWAEQEKEKKFKDLLLKLQKAFKKQGISMKLPPWTKSLTK
jgi:hypothetical protein